MLTLTPQPDPPAAEQLRQAVPKLAELSELARVEEDGEGAYEGQYWADAAGALDTAIGLIKDALAARDARLKERK